MSDKPKIKVIKRTDAAELPRKRRKVRVKSARERTRELASTVTDWVADLKDRKSQETRAALDLLFSGRHPARES